MLAELRSILEHDNVSILYQPIIDKHTGHIFGYEALTRGPSDSVLHSPLSLFEHARQNNLLAELEYLCRKKAIEGFVHQELPGKLFLNISPEALEDAAHKKGQTQALLNKYGLTANQLVIELTEQYPGTDEALLLNALKYYQEMGFAIALDDLGSGYSSLRLWSQANPEFVKIDRHFVQDIDQDVVKQEFVRSFVEIAKSIQCKVIAEGIETEAEFEYLCNLKIDYLQGYYFCKPLAEPPQSIRLDRTARPNANNRIHVTAEKLIVHSFSVVSHCPTEQVVELFQNKPHINSIAVVQNDMVVGMVHRSHLLELFSKPFGRDLHGKHPIERVMERKPLTVEHNLTIDQVSMLVTSRARYHQEDDFIINQDGKFMGVGHVIDLLKQITEVQIKQARHANPLTLLPGIVPVNDCIESLLCSNKEFIIAHFDIDNFKPFNDVYGFAKGDEIILALSQSLQKHAIATLDTVGHIGGDDFIVIWNSPDWRTKVEALVKDFSRSVEQLYHQEHRDEGGFISTDRYGEKRFIPIVTLSIASLTVSSQRFESAFDVSSQLSPLKHAAKQQLGHSLVLDSAQTTVKLNTANPHETELELVH